MTWTIVACTVIHVAPAAHEPLPYAVVVATRGAEQTVARIDGALDSVWIGAPVTITDGTARPGGEV